MKTLHITTASQLIKTLTKLERCGKYDEALTKLADIWKDKSQLPNVSGYDTRTAAEVILRCGALIGFVGCNKQILNSQENSKDMLCEARQRFLEIYDVEKVAECENYLALAYWRKDEINESQAWIEQALIHKLPNKSQTRLYSYVIQGKIDFSKKCFSKICKDSAFYQNDFIDYGDDFLKGNHHNHWGLAFLNLGSREKALEYIETAKEYFYKIKHHVFSSSCENNLAYIYKQVKDFDKAHECIDNAARIFKRINDRARLAFSLDTKAVIYLEERKYQEALQTIEAAITELSRGENKGYLVESLMTKAKILLFMEEKVTNATMCLLEAVNIARINTSQEKAHELIEEFEKARSEKEAARPETKPANKRKFFNTETIKPEEKRSNNSSGDIELVLAEEISHYDDLRGVWITTDNFKKQGLRMGELAIVAEGEFNRGELIVICELNSGETHCGFYDNGFGLVCLERDGDETLIFNKEEVEIYGKIIGSCKSETSDGKRLVRPIKPTRN